MRIKTFFLILSLLFVGAACNQKISQTESVGEVSGIETTQIVMTASGFEPSDITIKKGTTVTFLNQDIKPRWPASASHPTHTDYPEFDPKQPVVAGASWSFTFDRVGKWKFHDHLNPARGGTITVVE
ncbi:MAG: cupredoxin domain-containing protein [Candidatus Doudnabacteria bacterium]|nr:cupredoxin domain-containing protein [Candidatus Doudnabacteria bacterium]